MADAFSSIRIQASCRGQLLTCQLWACAAAPERVSIKATPGSEAGVDHTEFRCHSALPMTFELTRSSTTRHQGRKAFSHRESLKCSSVHAYPQASSLAACRALVGYVEARHHDAHAFFGILPSPGPLTKQAAGSNSRRLSRPKAACPRGSMHSSQLFEGDRHFSCHGPGYQVYMAGFT